MLAMTAGRIRRLAPLAARPAMIAAAFAAGLAACETPIQIQELPELTYGYLGRYRLDVAAVEVVSEYRAPMRAPNVEHLFPTPPEDALRRWANDRLEAAGRRGVARFVVKEAGVTETPLEVETGFTGAFKKQQSARFEATVEAILELVDERGFRKGFASARASRSRTVGEDITLDERNRTWFDLTESLMRDFNAEMERNIGLYFGGYLL